MHKELNILVLARSEATGSEPLIALAKIQSLNHQLLTYSGNHPLRDSIPTQQPDVVILELSSHNDELLEDIRRYVELHGHSTEVFATFPDSDMQLVKHLMRSGVRDVLPQPIDPQELDAALSHSKARQQRSLNENPDRTSSVIGFLGSRGNAGATFLAVNVACQLTTEFKKKTALVDLDLQFGTVASSLELKPDGDVLEALLNPERVDSIFLDALVTRHANGLDVLPSPADLSSYEQLTAPAAARLIAVLAETHDHVIINFPQFINDGITQALKLCNPLFLVTQDTVCSLRNLKMLTQRLPTYGVSLADMQIIHNRVGDAVKDIKPAELRELIGDVPVHRVRSDYRLASFAENAGRSATEMSPRSGLTNDIRAIASKLAGTKVEESGVSRWRSIRWFS
jgi:pilus assembly protein CpaE